MFWRNFAAYAATSVFAFSGVIASAAPPAPCWQTGELPAARLHDFKTMLLVGALKCRDRAPGALEGYNQFVNQKRDLIISSIHVVKARFIRDGGMTSGMNGFTDYETSLANRYSAMAHDDGFCGQVGTYARLAANASDEDIGVLAGTVAHSPSSDLCEPEARSVAKLSVAPPIQPAVAMTEPLTVAPAPAAAAEGDADADEVAPIAAGASLAAAPAEEAPAVVPVVAHDEPKAVTPPAPTAAQALAEAAKALAAAAVALNGQNADPATASPPD